MGPDPALHQTILSKNNKKLLFLNRKKKSIIISALTCNNGVECNDKSIKQMLDPASNLITALCQ